MFIDFAAMLREDRSIVRKATRERNASEVEHCLSPAEHPGLYDVGDGLGVSRVDGIEQNHSVVPKIRAKEWAAVALRIKVDFHGAHSVPLLCSLRRNVPCVQYKTRG
jgi:hypothetical protein